MSDLKTYAIHPACAKWPRPSTDKFEELVADIRAKGLLNPIWLTEHDEILEGKIRYEACLQAGVEPKFDLYIGDDPIGFTISQNKLRRHMSLAELAFIGEELALLRNGTNRYQQKVATLASVPTFEKACQAKIAQQLGIDKRAISDARAIKTYGAPNVVELAKTGQVGLKNAAAFARHTSREEQCVADRKTVKSRGNQMRSPLKNGINSKRWTATVRSKRISEIKFSSEQIGWLNEQLRPLIKRLRFQSKQHILQFAPFELERVAFAMEQLLVKWGNDGSEVVGLAPSVVVNDKQSGKGL